MQKFKNVIIDLPLRFKTHSEKGQDRSPQSKYDVMTTEDMIRLGEAFKPLLKQRAAVWLWTSGPYLERCMYVASKWGLQYSTIAFVWVKLRRNYQKDDDRLREKLRNVHLSYEQFREFYPPVTSPKHYARGTGYWTRAGSEMILLFTTKDKPARIRKDIPQVIPYPLLPRHSEKPKIFHDEITRLTGEQGLELFARDQYLDWVCLGNDLTGNDIFVDLAGLRGKP